MNPFDLDATGLMVWGLVAHLIADWPFQNAWMAAHKAQRRVRPVRYGDGVLSPSRPYQSPDKWWDRHPAAYAHAGIHVIFLLPVFGWLALALGLLHLVIDTRWPVVKWSKFIGQDQPKGEVVSLGIHMVGAEARIKTVTLYDIGLEVRFWTDQVFHIACLAVAALLVG